MADTLAELIDSLVRVDATIASLTSVKTDLLESVRVWSELVESASDHSTPASRDLAFRSVRAEVACALRIPERTAENLFGEARFLTQHLPVTLEAMRWGEISYRHAQVIIDHAGALEAENLETFERLVVSVAATSTVVTLKRQAHKLREGLDPSTIKKRARQEFENREVTWSPARDGMGWLSLYISAPEGQAAYTRATQIALKLRDEERGSDNPRTLAQLRLDVMRDALLCETFNALGGALVKPDVFVTVPVFSLMGLTDEPAQLDGYGPIDAETARKLAGNATSFVRLLAHPITGAVLSVDRDRYSPPNDLSNAVRVRYAVCGFYGCNQPAERCDIDHTLDWNRGGKTALANLAPLCRGHHTVKHHTLWKVTQAADGGGALTWTSPSGRTYVKLPEDRAHPPEIPPF